LVSTQGLSYTRHIHTLKWPSPSLVMFDIGFFEICLIGIIALLVIGPEKLPRVARTTGLWLGKARGMVKTVKYEIDEQVRIEELKQSLERAKNSIDSQLNDSMEEVKTSVNDLQDDIKNTVNQSDTEDTTPTPSTKSAK